MKDRIPDIAARVDYHDLRDYLAARRWSAIPSRLGHVAIFRSPDAGATLRAYAEEVFGEPFDADSVIGTYEYRPWEPDGNNRRKGLAIIKLRGDEAYYYLQETDQRYWDSVAGTFRASAATLRVDPPAGG